MSSMAKTVQLIGPPEKTYTENSERKQGEARWAYIDSNHKSPTAPIESAATRSLIIGVGLDRASFMIGDKE